MKNIETLSKDVDSIKQEIEQLKLLVDQQEKEKKKVEIEQRISDTQSELQKKIDELKETSDTSAKEELERVETLSSSLHQLSSLMLEIVSSKSSSDLEKTENVSSKSSEKKWFWERTKEMWNEWWWTRAKMGFSIAGISAGVYSVVRLFKWRSKEEKEEHQKKSWRGRTWGNIKRYTGIALWGIGWFFGIKWLIDKYGENTPWNHDIPENQVENYEKLNEKEQQPYEQLGNATDTLYESIFTKELENGWEDDADMNTLSQSFGKNKTLKWVVPWCIDNSFSSVGSVLSESWIEWDLLKQDMSGISIWLKNKISTPIGKSLLSFLSLFPSWVPWTKSAEEYIKDWIEENPEERKMQLKAFFRQQNRITVFLKMKQGNLVKKIAEKKFQSDPSWFENWEEAVEDAEWFKRNIEDDIDYQSFRSGTIANASSILSRYQIMNGEIDKDTLEQLKDCDERREEILDDNGSWNDVLTRVKSDLESWSLSDKNKEQLRKSCKEIQKDIIELEKIAEKDALDMYAKLGNTENINKQELLNHGTILPLLKKIREEGFTNIDAKIAEGKFSMEDYDALKQVMNNYFALKKEIEIWTQTYQLIKHDDGSWWVRIGNFALDCFKNMWTGIEKWSGGDFWSGLGWFATGVAPIVIVGAGARYAVKRPWKTLLFVAKTPFIIPAMYTWWLRTARFVSGKYVGPSGSIRRIFFSEADWPAKLVRALKEGHLSLDKASAIIDGSQGKFMKSNVKTKWNSLYSSNSDTGKRILLKEVFKWNTLSSDADWNLVAKYFDKRAINKRLIGKTTDDILKVLDDLKYCEKITMSIKNKKVFEMILDNTRLSSTDLRLLVDNIGKIDIAQFSEKELNLLIKQLSKKVNWSSFWDVNKLNDIVDGVKRNVVTGGWDAVDGAVDAMADIVKNHSFTGSLDNELSALKTEKDMLTDNNLIKKITKEMDYIETMKWELKTLKNVDELDALQMLWIQVKKSKKWPWEMLEFLRDVKRLLDTPEFRHLSKIEWDNLRVLKNSWNSEVIERVAKVMDDIRVKNLTKLTDNWFEAMTNWVKILIKFLAKAT